MMFPIPSQTISKVSSAAETNERDTEDIESSSTPVEVQSNAY